MRKLQLRGEEVLRVILGLDEFCNNTTQRNEIKLLMTFIFTLEGAQQLQARARRPRWSQGGRRWRRSTATGSDFQVKVKSKMAQPQVSDFLSKEMGFWPFFCSSDSEASHQDADIVKVNHDRLSITLIIYLGQINSIDENHHLIDYLIKTTTWLFPWSKSPDDWLFDHKHHMINNGQMRRRRMRVQKSCFKIAENFIC